MATMARYNGTEINAVLLLFVNMAYQMRSRARFASPHFEANFCLHKSKLQYAVLFSSTHLLYMIAYDKKRS